MPVRLLTIAEYARHRGCDEKAVRKALAEGRISRIGTDRRCIDPDVADIQWARNTRARGDSGPKAKPPPDKPGSGAGEGEATGNGEDYTSMRARRERAEAMMAEIELAKASGKVLDREPALLAVFNKYRELRDTAMVLGRKVAPVVAQMRDEREIRILIDRAQSEIFDTFVKRSLQSLADGLTGKPTVLPPEVRVAPDPVDQDAAP